MNKQIKQIACMLTALSLLLTAVGCKKQQQTTSSDEVLGIEYLDESDSEVGSGESDNSDNFASGSDNAPSSLEINKSSKGAKVVNNCYETGYPIAKEKVTLNVMAVDYSDGVDYNGMPFTAFVEQKFNVKLKFTMISGTAAKEKVTLAYTSGNMPDMFWGIGIVENNTLFPYEKEGRAYALDGELSKYTPNLNAMFEKRKDAKYLTTRDDGHIYTFPLVREDSGLWWEKLYINTTWLKKLGLSMPKTTDDLKEVLRAFKNNDPNGNGKQDEIPMAFYQEVPHGWYGIFGLGTADFMSKDNSGNVTFVPTNPKYRTALSFLADLYQEKLLYNKEIRSLSAAKIKSMIESKNNTIGITQAENYSQIMSADTFLNNYAVMPLIDGTGNGTNTWSYRDTEMLWPNWAEITKACKYPEVAARLMDYFYSTEGAAVAAYGPYGKNMYWNYDSNGNPVINNNGKDYNKLSPAHAVPRYYNDSVLAENFFTNKAIDKDASKQKAKEVESAQIKEIFKNVKPNYVYNYRYTQEETETLNKKVSSNLYSTHTTWRFDFIYGVKNIDTEWDGYVNSINSQGAATLQQIKQAADKRLMDAIK